MVKVVLLNGYEQVINVFSYPVECSMGRLFTGCIEFRAIFVKEDYVAGTCRVVRGRCT